jgi:hypothetical protein
MLEVVYEVRAAARFEPLTRDDTLRFGSVSVANSRCFQCFQRLLLDLWVGVHCRVKRGLVT